MTAAGRPARGWGFLPRRGGREGAPRAVHGWAAPGAPRAALAWAAGGLLFGTAAGVVLYAPAAWLAEAVARASDGHLLLTEARGSVWSGSAVVVLAGGSGSRDASRLPGRLAWQARPVLSGGAGGVGGPALRFRASHACCLHGEVGVLLGRSTLAIDAASSTIGDWPARWFEGLGTPWNTLQPGGRVRLQANHFRVALRRPPRIAGSLAIDLVDASSRLSTLPVLGSYRVELTPDPQAGGAPRLAVSTVSGALQVSGTGGWSPGGWRFRGEASAAPGDVAALGNLLNIIGRRAGARSVISIG